MRLHPGLSPRSDLHIEDIAFIGQKDGSERD